MKFIRKIYAKLNDYLPYVHTVLISASLNNVNEIMSHTRIR